MKDTVTMVYRGPNAFVAKTGYQLWFDKDVPQEVLAHVAEEIMQSMATPEQLEREKFHDVFEVLDVEGGTE